MSDIVWLQEWFNEQCDGEYEDGPGVRIESLETPGWWVAIDLEGTPLAGKPFEPVDVHRSDQDWFKCTTGDWWTADCAPTNLAEVLAVFRAWAEK